MSERNGDKEKEEHLSVDALVVENDDEDKAKPLHPLLVSVLPAMNQTQGHFDPTTLTASQMKRYLLLQDICTAHDAIRTSLAGARTDAASLPLADAVMIILDNVCSALNSSFTHLLRYRVPEIDVAVDWDRGQLEMRLAQLRDEVRVQRTRITRHKKQFHHLAMAYRRLHDFVNAVRSNLFRGLCSIVSSIEQQQQQLALQQQQYRGSATTGLGVISRTEVLRMFSEGWPEPERDIESIEQLTTLDDDTTGLATFDEEDVQLRVSQAVAKCREAEERKRQNVLDEMDATKASQKDAIDAAVAAATTDYANDRREFEYLRREYELQIDELQSVVDACQDEAQRRVEHARQLRDEQISGISQELQESMLDLQKLKNHSVRTEHLLKRTQASEEKLKVELLNNTVEGKKEAFQLRKTIQQLREELARARSPAEIAAEALAPVKAQVEILQQQLQRTETEKFRALESTTRQRTEILSLKQLVTEKEREIETARAAESEARGTLLEIQNEVSFANHQRRTADAEKESLGSKVVWQQDLIRNLKAEMEKLSGGSDADTAAVASTDGGGGGGASSSSTEAGAAATTTATTTTKGRKGPASPKATTNATKKPSKQQQAKQQRQQNEPEQGRQEEEEGEEKPLNVLNGPPSLPAADRTSFASPKHKQKQRQEEDGGELPTRTSQREREETRSTAQQQQSPPAATAMAPETTTATSGSRKADRRKRGGVVPTRTVGVQCCIRTASTRTLEQQQQQQQQQPATRTETSCKDEKVEETRPKTADTTAAKSSLPSSRHELERDGKTQRTEPEQRQEAEEQREEDDDDVDSDVEVEVEVEEVEVEVDRSEDEEEEEEQEEEEAEEEERLVSATQPQRQRQQQEGDDVPSFASPSSPSNKPHSVELTRTLQQQGKMDRHSTDEHAGTMSATAATAQFHAPQRKAIAATTATTTRPNVMGGFGVACQTNVSLVQTATRNDNKASSSSSSSRSFFGVLKERTHTTQRIDEALRSLLELQEKEEEEGVGDSKQNRRVEEEKPVHHHHHPHSHQQEYLAFLQKQKQAQDIRADYLCPDCILCSRHLQQTLDALIALRHEFAEAVAAQEAATTTNKQQQEKQESHTIVEKPEAKPVRRPSRPLTASAATARSNASAQVAASIPSIPSSSSSYQHRKQRNDNASQLVVAAQTTAAASQQQEQQPPQHHQQPQLLLQTRQKLLAKYHESRAWFTQGSRQQQQQQQQQEQQHGKFHFVPPPALSIPKPQRVSLRAISLLPQRFFVADSSATSQSRQ